MSDEEQSLFEAERDRNHARRELRVAIGTLQRRLNPAFFVRTIARNVFRGVRAEARDAARSGQELLKAHRGAIAGATALGVLALAAGPISRVLARPKAAPRPKAPKATKAPKAPKALPAPDAQPRATSPRRLRSSAKPTRKVQK